MLRTEIVHPSSHTRLGSLFTQSYSCAKAKVMARTNDLDRCVTYDTHYDETLEHYPLKIWNEGQYISYVDRATGDHVIKSKTLTDLYYSPLDMTKVLEALVVLAAVDDKSIDIDAAIVDNSLER